MAKSLTVESRSKAGLQPAAESFNQIIRQLKNSNHVFLCSHVNPDGDAIASTIAMGLSLSLLQKETTLYNESPVPVVYRFLPSTKRIVRHIPACPVGTADRDRKTVYDTAIVFDCGDLHRVGKEASFVSSIPVIINIDHHVSNTRFGNFQLIDSSACATVEIIYRLLKEMDLPISKDVATLIYTGILTDTGSFHFSNTNKSAFTICKEMIDIGVDPYYVARNIYEALSPGYIKLLHEVLGSIEISKNGKLAMITLTQEMLDETGARPEEVNGLINYAKAINNVKIAVLIHRISSMKGEGQGRFRVSLRSDGTVDVAAVASSFGGGGHYMAAGFSVESSTIDLKNRIFSLAEKV
ncbi:MAG: bifunctional oligoribonuclease/PAP phosphatase NrnA [Thermodesulfobacteriota bacterium]|nr:bifunctional oligoribonuclease/PAP phosphatase NrnA [Thermodesulfobacteriota bacterium]